MNEESTEPDPAEDQDAWKRVGDEFSTLGTRFKGHFEKPEGGGPEKLLDSLKAAFDSLGEAAKDERVRADAKSAGASFMEAIGDTFAELGDTLRKKAEDARRSEMDDMSAATGDPIDEAHAD